MNFRQMGETSKIAISALWAFPRRTVLIAALFIFASMAEGFGVASMLPLLSLFGEGATGNTNVARAVTSILGTVGLAPTLAVLLTFIAAGIVLKSALMFVAMGQLGFATAGIAAELRKNLLEALMRARWAFFVNEPIGILANAFGVEANNAAAIVGWVALMFALAGQILVYLAIAFFVSWQVTVAAIGAGIIIFVSLDWLVGMARRASAKYMLSMRALISQLVDSLQGIKPLKAMAAEDRVGPLLEDEIGNVNRATRTAVIAKEAMSSIQEPLLVILLCLGFYFVLTYTTLSFDLVLIMGFLFYRTASRFGELQRGYQNLSVSREFYVALQEKIVLAEVSRETHSGKKTPNLSTNVQLESVDFSYADNKVLSNVSIEIPAGKVTAIIGPSGSGKTTTIDLILGFLEPDRGRISLDNVDLKDMDIHNWRQKIGYVPQELFLFHGNIMQNVTLGDPSITEDEAIQALRQAGANEFVAGLPDGINTFVGERGSRLSGGQRQRISIARALARTPSLLVLDEPTTALDPTTEKEICKTLSELPGNITILAISHQQAIADIADRVYKMVDGSVSRELEVDTNPHLSSVESGK